MNSLFKLLAKKHQKISEKLNSLPSTPTSSSPTTDGAPDFVSLYRKFSANINLTDIAALNQVKPYNYMYVILLLYTRKFSPGENLPILPMHAIGKFFFCTVKISTHLRVHTYVHSNSRAPPTTSWKVTRAIYGIQFDEIFVPIHSMSLWQKF